MKKFLRFQIQERIEVILIKLYILVLTFSSFIHLEIIKSSITKNLPGLF